jgi:hypothetical protein
MGSDLEKAHLIVGRKVYVRSAGTMHKHIARDVAQGIALGRREGLELAAKAIADALSNLPPKTA